jgi:hydroxymethylbilane synthase
MTTTDPIDGRVRIATRRSALALWQAEHVAALLRAAHPGLTVELVPLSTQGDRVQDRALAEVGGKGLFVKELEVALAEDRADAAVHSMKDVPSELPPGFRIAAALPRADARDAFISLHHSSLDALPRGAIVGTSSPRRQAQLRSLRPDLRLELLRGNVDTRLRRLEEGRFAAILLACAGLDRLGWGARTTERIAIERCVPAVGQGVIGIECRTDDVRTATALAALHEPISFARLEVERAFARRLGASCHSPIAAHAELDGEQLFLRAFIGAPDGSRAFRDTERGPLADPQALGTRLAERMLAAGADALLAALHDEAVTARHAAPP